ncbi:hypothetical protein ACFQ14_16395 [Pseudahrensia aquimaris]|uniref:Uncharacterized protein n=1 Tax=Pseudahrensia aquimaris TaxID=744461 RepID=A0ABW3FL56_9HYPH
MGLYDNIICEYPLPEPIAPDGVEFQTKDTPDPHLRVYTITANGRLHLDGSDQNFDGEVRFYGDGDTSGEWYDYCAKFTDGQLLEITLVKAQKSTV